METRYQITRYVKCASQDIPLLASWVLEHAANRSLNTNTDFICPFSEDCPRDKLPDSFPQGVSHPTAGKPIPLLQILL